MTVKNSEEKHLPVTVPARNSVLVDFEHFFLHTLDKFDGFRFRKSALLPTKNTVSNCIETLPILTIQADIEERPTSNFA